MAIREACRDILAVDLSPSLYPILNAGLHRLIPASSMKPPSSHDQTAGGGNSAAAPAVGLANSSVTQMPVSSSAMVAKQTVAVLAKLLAGGSDQIPLAVGIDFTSLILACCEWTAVLSENLKLSLCRLISVLMEKKDRLVLRNLQLFRNRVILIVISWQVGKFIHPPPFAPS